MKYITLIIWILISGSLAAQHRIQDSTFQLEVILDSATVPVEMYDSVSFVNWVGTPSMMEYVAADQEPVLLNSDEFNHCFTIPQVIRDSRISLSYMMRLLINEQGEIVRIVGLKGYEPWLMSLQGCVNQLQWSPAMKNGKPVMFWVNWGSRCILLLE